MTAMTAMTAQDDGMVVPAARARRRLRTRQRRARLLILVLAVALPTLATQGDLGAFGRSFGIDPNRGIPVAQPFETPGQSFPGSAFYWTQDTAIEIADLDQWRAGEGQYDIAQFAQAHGEAGAAAEAFRAGGTGLDKARALQCLSMAIYYEAANESLSGQEAVAQVVLNRVAHPAFPNSICGVVFQGSERRTGCQFSFTCDGSLRRKPGTFAWARAQGVALAALAGHVFTPVGLATHYHADYVNPYWAPSLHYITAIGRHRFYRWQGKAGTSGAFTSRYTGFEGLAVPAPGSIGAAGDAASAPALPTPPPNSALGSAPIAQAVAAPPKPPVTGDNLPGGGAVKDPYRNSGRWIAEPGKPKGD